MPSFIQPGAVLTFLRELRSTGAPILRLHGQGAAKQGLLQLEADAREDLLLLPLLKSWHEEAAEDLGGPALPFEEAAARHGVQLLLRMAWFYLQRDTDASTVTRLLAEPCPFPAGAAAQFSADLTLQYLPAIFRMAQALAPGDPLLASLRNLAGLWPLSGTGVPLGSGQDVPMADPAAWEALRTHAGLWQLFLDRLLQRPDSPWLRHPDVVSGLTRLLGAYGRELAPALPAWPPALPENHAASLS